MVCNCMHIEVKNVGPGRHCSATFQTFQTVHRTQYCLGQPSDVFKSNTQLFTQLVRCVWMCKWSFVARAAHSLRLVSTLEWKWYSSDSVIFPSLEVVINVTPRDPENFSLRSEPQKDLCSRVGCPLTSLSGICQSKAEYNLAGSSVSVYICIYVYEVCCQ